MFQRPARPLRHWFSFFALIGLLLTCGIGAAQDAVVYYRGSSYSGPASDACVNPEVFASTAAGVAALKVNTNNSLGSCTPGAACYDPVDLISVTDTSYTVRSKCNGGMFTHPITKLLNPKDDPEQCCEGNPINPRTGAKYQVETDFPGTAAGELKLVRYYNSARDPERASGFGDSWRHNYMRRLQVIIGTANDPVPYDAAFARRPTGQILTFKKVSGAWQPDADVTAMLVDVLNGSGQVVERQLTIGEAEEVEIYDLAGRVTSIKNRNGRTHTLTYDVAGKLTQVTDPAGRTLTFAYDASNRISQVTDPIGWVYGYSYGASNNLTSVTRPDTHTRQYVYNEPANTGGANLPRALTGIIDENGVRFATYQYDVQGRATSTTHANGANSTTLTYVIDSSGVPLSAEVTDARGTLRTRNFAAVLGTIKDTQNSLPGGGGPQASSQT